MNPRQAALALLWAVLATPWARAQEPARAAPALDPVQALRDSEAAIGRSVGRHALLDGEGRPVRLSDYGGKPLLVSFIYTGCFQVCPTTTKSLALAVEQLTRVVGADSFNVVSIGFNQPFDSPAAMRAFERQMRVGASNWHFLSPPAASVDALTKDFGFRFAATPAGFDHMLTVSVLDADGRIAAQVYGDRLSADQLGEPVRRLLRGTPVRTGMPLRDLVERVRVLCTVYDPATGEYRTDYGLALEIAGGATFAIAMAWFFVNEWRTQRRARRQASDTSAAPRAGPQG